MRITVSHNKPKEEIKTAVDRSFDDLFKGPPGFLPVQMVNQQRAWNGNKLNFSFDAKAGIISTPIKGYVDVTDKEIDNRCRSRPFGKALPSQTGARGPRDQSEGTPQVGSQGERL